MGSPAIFNGLFTKLLTGSGIKFRDNVRIVFLTVDPTSVATLGEAGSLGLRDEGSIYAKQDAGTTTNWTLLAASSGAAGDLDIINKTGNYTILATDEMITVDSSSGGFTLTLPTAASAGSGKRFWIKKISSDTNGVTIDGNSAETIDGDLTQVLLTQYTAITIISDGSNYLII